MLRTHRGAARTGLAILAVLAFALLGPTSAGAATIKVTTVDDELNDDSDCSLREAVQAANTNKAVSGCEKGQRAKRDTIQLRTKTYNLTIPSTDEDLNANGDLDHTGGGALTIRGPEVPAVINAPAHDRALEATSGATALKLQRLTLVGDDVSELPGTGNEWGGTLKVVGPSLALTRALVVEGLARVGGGLYLVSDRPLLIDRTTFSYNDAINGAGMHAFGDGSATITRSIFHDNEALSGAARGGAITTSMERTTITDTLIRNNTTSSAPGGSSLGAGIYAAAGGLVVRRSLIAENRAEETGDTVGAGGGGISAGGVNRISNTTFHDNFSADEGGGFAGEAKLSHVTFLANQADDPGDHVHGDGDGVVLRNSLLPGAQIAVDLCAGAVTSKGFSAATYDDPGCGFLDSDVFGAVALVPGGPADNGGATNTVAIRASSIAKDLVPKAKCKVAKGEDQRGFERPKGERCDAGAFERGAQP